MVALPRPRCALALGTAVVLVTGCGAGGDAPSGGDGSARPVIHLPSPTPAPLAADIPVPGITATANGEAGTAVITMGGGGTVYATAADGTGYMLEIPAGALALDTEVSLQPLSGTTEVGGIVAGADFGPAGTELALAAILTIDLPAAPAGALVGIGFSGDADETTGRILSGVGPDAANGVLQIPIHHSSGALAVAPTDAGALYAAWAATKPGAGPEGTQATADTWTAAATLGASAGIITPAQSTADLLRAQEAWMEAELDRLRKDPAMERLKRLALTDEIGALGVQFSVVYRHELSRDTDAEAEAAGSPAHDEATTATKAVLDEYEQHVGRAIEGLRDEVANVSKSGEAGVMEGTAAKIETLAGVERGLGELGAGGAEAIGELIKMSKAMADGVRATCKDAPTSSQLLASLRRGAVLEGKEPPAGVDMDSLGDCDSSSQKPDLPDGPMAVDGTIHFSTSFTTPEGRTEYAVDLKVRIREGEEALIFARGSSFAASYRFAPRVITGEGGEVIPWACPTNASWSGSLGTESNSGGWDPGSEASPLGSGFAMLGGNDTLEISAGVYYDPDQFQEGCSPPGVAVECPAGDFLTGELVGDRPPTWDFSCSSGANDTFATAGGRLEQVVVGQEPGAGAHRRLGIRPMFLRGCSRAALPAGPAGT